MGQVSAALVKELRDRTQLPMMDCKRALQEAGGDPSKAEEALRKSGALAAAKKAGRETAEGRVAVHVSDDKTVAGIVEIRCETAPVASTDSFVTLCEKVACHVATSEPLADSPEVILAQTVPSEGRTVQDLFNDVINKIRENMQVARFTRLTGEMIVSYQHHNGQVAVLVELGCEGNGAADESLLQLGRDLCMHVTAASPMALDRDGISADLVASEKEIIAAQVAEQGKNKPPEIVEKIVMGKLNKWYNERVLLEQPFVKDDKKSVKQVVAEFSKGSGQAVTIKRFLRYEVGGTEG